MEKLTRADLYGLEKYAEIRKSFRDKVIAHKKNRYVALGEHLRISFEDRLTIQYQIQEMLRVERIFESSGIEDELDAYNPLIPDGQNWKATCMLEYVDVDERQRALAALVGIEDRIWVQVAGCERVYAIADEDLDRDTDEKTSAVHFLRFDLTPQMATAVKSAANVAMGVDHHKYSFVLDALPREVRESLAADLTSH